MAHKKEDKKKDKKDGKKPFWLKFKAKNKKLGDGGKKDKKDK